MSNTLSEFEIEVRSWSNMKLSYKMEQPHPHAVVRAEAIRRLRWPDVYMARAEA